MLLDRDQAEIESYSPISNLSVLSKTLERITLRQMIDHSNTVDHLLDVQSTYYTDYSIEVAVQKVLGDIIPAVDSGPHVARLVRCL